MNIVKPSDVCSGARSARTRVAPGGRSRRAELVIVSLLGALTIAVYAAALDGPFLLDDFSNLPGARPLERTWSGVVDVMFANESGPLGRPLAILSFALQYLSDPGGAFAFKVVNLGIHLLNALLLGCVADRLLRASERGAVLGASGNPSARTLALFGCVAVFALHPLQVSTVMYVVQRMTLLAQTFALLAILAYVAARADASLRARTRLALAGAVAPAIGLGILCKETAALVPVYIVLIEITVFRLSGVRLGRAGEGRGLSDRGARVALLLCSILLAAVGAFLLLRTNVLDPLLAGYGGRDFTLAERAATQPGVMLEYLRMVVLPDPGIMSFYHDDIAVGRTSAVAIAGASLAIAALAGVALWALPRARLVTLGIGLFLSSHLLESTVFPLEPMFEHRNYTGMGGVGLVVAGLLARVTNERLARAIVGVSVIALAVLTLQRCIVWSDELTLNRFAVDAAPASLRARSAYAISLVRAGDVPAALVQLETAAELAPEDPYFPLEILQTKALAGQASAADIRRAAASLESGTLATPVETVLADLLRNAEAGRLDGLDPPDLSSLYAIAERRYGEFVSATSHARLVAKAAEAHLLAGRHRLVLTSADNAARLAPRSVAIALRRLELRAGLQPESVDAAALAAFAEARLPLDAGQRERLAAVRTHVAGFLSD